jgi:predicted small lipoprotein YifL
MHKKIIIVLVLLIPLLMSCGTKGSLYIPEEKYPQNDSFNKQDNNYLSNFSVT